MLHMLIYLEEVAGDGGGGSDSGGELEADGSRMMRGGGSGGCAGSAGGIGSANWALNDVVQKLAGGLLLVGVVGGSDLVVGGGTLRRECGGDGVLLGFKRVGGVVGGAREADDGEENQS